MSGPDTKSQRLKRLIVQRLDALLGRSVLGRSLLSRIQWRGESAASPGSASSDSGRLWDRLGQGAPAAPTCPEPQGSRGESTQGPESPRASLRDPPGCRAPVGAVPPPEPSQAGAADPIGVSPVFNAIPPEPGLPESSGTDGDAVAGLRGPAADTPETRPWAPDPPARPETTPRPSTRAAAAAPPAEPEHASPRLGLVAALSPTAGPEKGLLSGVVDLAPSADLLAEAPTQAPGPPVQGEASAVRHPGWVIPLEPRPLPRPRMERRVVVIGDCENDSACVEASLRFLGVLNKRGGLKAHVQGAQILQTGDLLYKNAPDLGIVRFWEGLRGAARAAGGNLHLLAGNHELEIWRRLRAGERLGLNPEGQRAVQGFIRSLALFHVEGSMLFLHGYPTLNFLRHLMAYPRNRGGSLNDYNRDHFQAALADRRQLGRYAYLRVDSSRNPLLHDLADPERYYRRYGREVARLLGALGIDLVVHGHRPERSGLQTDYELRKWLPGIRMINNDIQLRLQGVGATLITQVESGPKLVRFVNPGTLTLAHRTDVRQLLRGVDGPLPIPERLDPRRPRDLRPAVVSARDWAEPALRGAMRAARG